MHLRDPESVESAAHAAPQGVIVPPPPAAATPPSCPIVALSDDPLLLEALTFAAVDSSTLSSAPSADRFIDQLVAKGAGIALIDAASVNTPLKGFLAALREQFPQLLLLLTGSAQLQSQLSAQIADGTIFRFVHKPASSQRLRLFIDAGMRKLAMAPEDTRTTAPTPPAGGRSTLALLGLSIAVLIAGALGWLFWHHTATPAPAPIATAPPAETLPAQSAEPPQPDQPPQSAPAVAP
jgi:hypothetical protein